MFFFFQAEDGIRDATVTGVQTCALPISIPHADPEVLEAQRQWSSPGPHAELARGRQLGSPAKELIKGSGSKSQRSEERRVGKECRSRWGPEQKKKKRRESKKRNRDAARV